jgi:hypothetical protein
MRTSRPRRLAARAVPAVLAAAAALTTAAGPALADPADGLTPGHGQLTPLLDCVTRSGSGFTAVLGYANSGTATEHARGADNAISPAALDGAQPTKFSSGTHHGVFAVTVTGSSATWTLEGTTLVIGPTSAACPPGTELPAEGNGTGPVLALVAAGLLGGLVVARARSRTA